MRSSDHNSIPKQKEPKCKETHLSSGDFQLIENSLNRSNLQHKQLRETGNIQAVFLAITGNLVNCFPCILPFHHF